MSVQKKLINGPVTVHSDPPLRRHRDRQLATPLGRRDVRACNLNGPVDVELGQGQDKSKTLARKGPGFRVCGSNGQEGTKTVVLLG
jgi:hypothetical protein